jgi:hypothetical protein
MVTFSALSQTLFDLESKYTENIFVWNKMDADYQSAEWQALAAAYSEAFDGAAATSNIWCRFMISFMLSKTLSKHFNDR